jgi:hypothetical protein
MTSGAFFTRHPTINNPNLEMALQNIVELGRPDAERLADNAIDLVIATLQRDSNRSSLDWLLKLANARQQIADQLHRRIHGHIARDEALNVVAKED